MTNGSDRTGREVVPLGNARIPADHGLTGLGLIMQLAGSLFATMTGLVGFTSLIALGMSRGHGGGGKALLWTLTIVLLGVARSAYHRAAGTEILYGPRAGAAVRRYVMFALVHTVVCLAFLKFSGDAPMGALVAVGALLVAWPATLAVAVLARLPAAELDAPLGVPEDKGFTGAGILMVVLGLVGTLYGVVLFKMMLDVNDRGAGGGLAQLMLLMVGLLVVRSIVHVHAGAIAARSHHLDTIVAATNRYANLGVISAVIAGAGMLIAGMAAGGGGALFLMFAVMAMAMLLLIWPLIIRRFVLERRFAGVADGGAIESTTSAAPDRGLTALGWLVLALGVLGLASSLPAAVLSSGTAFDDRSELVGMMMQLLPTAAGHSPWWTVLIAALQVWAGWELVTMSDRHRLAGTVYGIGAAIVTVWLNFEVLERLERLDVGLGGDGMTGLTFHVAIALSLIVPIATAILVNRGAPPAAQARYVGRDGDA